MKGAAGVVRPILGPAPIATCVLRFEQKAKKVVGKERPCTVGRIPRVARLLALAHRIEGMIQAGELKDWADAARLAGVTRARMTQIANLLLLAPHIQESLLSISPVVTRDDLVSERALRSVVSKAAWEYQVREWGRIS